jgi:excisionase family DNA binding protein
MLYNSDILTISEAANMLHVSEGTIRNLIRQDAIPAFRVGRQWRMIRSEVWAFLNTRDPRPPRPLPPCSNN